MAAHLDVYQISPKRRELFFRVINDHADIHPITMRLYFLQEHFPPHKVDSCLVWLISNGLIGKRFVIWFQNVCKGSDLEMHRFLLSVVDNQSAGQLIAGKNFKL